MTSSDHPITPTHELIDAWGDEWCDAKVKGVNLNVYVAVKAARWGADVQLGTCLKWLQDHGYDLAAPELQDHCRPSKPQPPQTVVIDGHTYRLEE